MFKPCLKMVVRSPLDLSKFNVELGTFFKPKKFKLFNRESEQRRLLKLAN